MPDILDDEIHDRLIRDLDKICEQAGIPKGYMDQSMHDYCDKKELNYIANLKAHSSNQIFGMCYVGEFDNLIVRMMVAGAACLRNYIGVKVMPLQEILDKLKKGDNTINDVSVLFIPNFFISKESGGNIPSWQVSQVYGLLLSRMSSGKQTVIYCEDLDLLSVNYGDFFKKHITSNFKLFKK